MMKILLAAFVLLLIPTSVAFAQVETVGSNYDITPNEDGTTTWSSHPDRILDNTWQNYFLETDEQKIIFRSNSIGGLIYDVSSCSYSLYENGFDGEQIIPSVSSVATYNPDGVWQHLPLNDLSCVVTVQENENGIVLTSTKEIDTNEKYTQELKIDIYNGVKETFKVWHDGTEELGISQTVHTGESIIIGNTTIPIAQYSGQSFDKDFIVANQAEILKLTDSINYEFSTGIKSLENVNIIFDGDYKVNLDFANGDDGISFINYLEIDPTFTHSSGGGASGQRIAVEKNYGKIFRGTGWYAYSGVYGVALEYDVSSIPSGAVVSSATFSSTGTTNTASGCDTVKMTNSPESYLATGGSSGSNGMYNDMNGSTTSYKTASSPSWCGSVGGAFTDTFNSVAITDLQSAVSSGGHFYWGFTSGGYSYALNPTDIFTVVYTLPTIPTSPQSLSTSQSLANEIILNYQAPSSDGGSAITNYKIYLGGTLIDTIGNVLTYTDTISGSEIGSGLTYSVVSVNAIGDSPASNNSFITSWDVPDAPTGFQAVTGSPITLSWVTPNSDDTITNYKIYRDGTLIDTIGAVNNYSDNTTVSGNSYSYTVSAVSAVGESSQSSASSATAGVPPDAPIISLAINDVNATPLDIEISISHGTSMGTGTFSNFVVQRS